MFFFEGGGYYSFGTPSNSYPKRRRFKPIALDGLLGQDDGMHGWVKFTSTHTLILLCIVHFTTTQFAVILVIQEGGAPRMVPGLFLWPESAQVDPLVFIMLIYTISS